MNLFEFEDRTPEQQAAAAEALHAANVARAVFHRRLDAGLTQGELAQIARTTQARVSEIEALKGDPKLSTLGRVVYALGCMIDVVPLPPTAVETFSDGYRKVAASTDLVATPTSGTAYGASEWGGGKAYG